MGNLSAVIDAYRMADQALRGAASDLKAALRELGVAEGMLQHRHVEDHRIYHWFVKDRTLYYDMGFTSSGWYDDPLDPEEAECLLPVDGVVLVLTEGGICMIFDPTKRVAPQCVGRDR